ncbi:hypothetical protein [Phyllobacterium myrsinacearum]|uniref:Uncharacterized protein n=1 Tax=Phyllobacterium myrsinacearum TaxID=28101 RepID=A0A839EKF8_9HYPH|nr:hypothetical protein [Phyllobacterium myrsinacearum]MBA8879309.1 hypothetical protein [Phyllobacterium myrsinacearum]
MGCIFQARRAFTGSTAFEIDPIALNVDFERVKLDALFGDTDIAARCRQPDLVIGIDFPNLCFTMEFVACDKIIEFANLCLDRLADHGVLFFADVGKMRLSDVGDLADANNLIFWPVPFSPREDDDIFVNNHSLRQSQFRDRPIKALIRLPGSVATRLLKIVIAVMAIPFTRGRTLVPITSNIGSVIGLFEGSAGRKSAHSQQTTGT